MFNIGPQELLLILLVALVIVGPKRLPEISRTIGRGLREFRKAQDEVTKTIRLGLDDLERAPGSPEGSEPTQPEGSEPTRAVAADETPETGPPAAVSPETSGSSEDAAQQVARTLGRGLAEIRRTRREIQRTFRIDLTEDPERPAGPPASPAPGPAEEPPVVTRPDDPAGSAGPG